VEVIHETNRTFSNEKRTWGWSSFRWSFRETYRIRKKKQSQEQELSAKTWER
jgi:hypothetical protein